MIKKKLVEFITDKFSLERSRVFKETYASMLERGLLRLLLVSYASHFFGLRFCSNDARLILFKSHTHTLTDNAKYLFLYFLENQLYDDIAWIACNLQTYSLLKNKGLPVLYFSYNAYRRAKAIVSTITPASYELVGWLKYFCLWHGLPLKSALWLNKYDYRLYNPIYRLLYKVLDPALFSSNFYLLSPDGTFRKVLKCMFNIEDRMLLYGPYPRNIVFLRHIRGEEINAFSSEQFPDGLRKVLYLPTFRDYDHNQNLAEILPLKEFNDLAISYDAVILIKPHYYVDYASAMRVHNKFSRIIVLRESKDVYPLLRDAEVLITDYSSVAYDFLYADKPIIYYIYDIEQYFKYRPAFVRFDLLTSGPKVHSKEDLLTALRKALEGEDEFKKDRKILRKIVWGSFAELKEAHFRNLAESILKVAIEAELEPKST
ncbi:MAG: CDP-glycerol glycerophosphotransferase family protein [Crenarchaeota archaeon]|nr:CDP-glycerol glycerophosphotransferase family protein [Thermoproteota archaeon]MCR8455175.1 CDP-glycerol glycerophosphotransferase family protein [Thermoproteota archaeon]